MFDECTLKPQVLSMRLLRGEVPEPLRDILAGREQPSLELPGPLADAVNRRAAGVETCRGRARQPAPAGVADRLGSGVGRARGERVEEAPWETLANLNVDGID
uniref:Uncharacterized protein n=2 Tax=Alexandrium monilatum TaxID=311494 RepID=A0A7S4VX90_9DINO